MGKERIPQRSSVSRILKQTLITLRMRKRLTIDPTNLLGIFQRAQVRTFI